MAKQAPKKGAGGRDYQALSDQAIAQLQRILTSRGKGRGAAGHKVAAAREILTHVRWGIDRDRDADPLHVLAQILGTETQALAWMRATLPILEARVRARALPREGTAGSP